MSDSLSNLGSPKVDATERTNTADQTTSILDLSPIDGLAIVLRDVRPGEAPGIPIYAELQDSNGNDLALDTDFVLRYDRPDADQPAVVSELRRNIRPYRTLSLKEQQDAEFRDQVRTEFKGGADTLTVRDIDTLQVAVDSPDVIDWANSRLEFDRRYVDIVSAE